MSALTHSNIIISEYESLMSSSMHELMDFLPALFGGTTQLRVDDNFRRLLSHSIKRGGLGIRNPTAVANRLFQASKEATTILAANLMHHNAFSVEAHCAQVQQAVAAM